MGLREKICDTQDAAHVGIGAGVALLLTGIVAAATNIDGVADMVEITAPVPWADSYWNTLRTFAEMSLYTVPGGAALGYIRSKIYSSMR